MSEGRQQDLDLIAQLQGRAAIKKVGREQVAALVTSMATASMGVG